MKTLRNYLLLTLVMLCTVSAIADETETTQNRVRDRFYGYAGRSALYIIGGGLTYTNLNNQYMADVDLLSFRKGLFGMSLLNFEGGVNPWKKWVAYRPTIKIYMPLAKWTSLYIYGGAETDMNWAGKYIIKDYNYDKDTEYFLSGFGGLAWQLIPRHWIPLEVRAEYRHPITNKDMMAQGIYFTGAFYLGYGRHRSNQKED